ncbi:MAG: LL-diaminopimelate aminotransferase [Planctomycetota bacterium]
MNDRLRNLPTYPMVALEKKKRELLARGARVFDFGTGDPIEPTPAWIRRAMIDAVPEISQYPSTAGLDSLRAAAAGYLERRFGVRVDPETEVLPTFGSKEAIFHLPQVLVQIPSEKDVVVYGEPAYPVFEVGALFAEAWTYPMRLGPENSYSMSPEAIPETALRRAAIVFLNYPHNPTGQCLSDELFRAWMEAREAYGFTLVSDECYADLYYGKTAPRSALEFGRRGCLALHSLSKRSGMTGYRSGFVAGDADLIAHFRRFRASIGTTPQEFVQAAAAAAWADDRHVEERRRTFAEKRRVLVEHFASRGMRVYPTEASLFLWVEVPERSSDVEYADRCLERGILIGPGSYFGPGQERFFRIAMVPSVEDCHEAAARWPD